MSAISMILVVLVAFLAGMGGILDEFQFHQPLVACTLIGLVTGNLYSQEKVIKGYYSNGFIYDSEYNIIGNYVNGYVKTRRK